MDPEVLFKLYERFILDSPPIRMLVKIKMVIAGRHLGEPSSMTKTASRTDTYLKDQPDNSISEETINQLPIYKGI